MSIRVQIYLLFAFSMLFLLFGAIGQLVVTVVIGDSGLSALTMAFVLVGTLGLHLTWVISGLSDRIKRLELLERLERSQANGSRELSDPVGMGSCGHAEPDAAADRPRV
jgi:hypothetical protein